MEKINYVELNAAAWTNVKEGLEKYGTAISHEKYIVAVKGELKVTLAGIKIVPQEWFSELKGADVLGLACGGGQQCPVLQRTVQM